MNEKPKTPLDMCIIVADCEGDSDIAHKGSEELAGLRARSDALDQLQQTWAENKPAVEYKEQRDFYAERLEQVENQWSLRMAEVEGRHQLETKSLVVCREIVLAIRDLCKDMGMEGIAFRPDWGDNSMTVEFAGGHTHLGEPDDSDEDMIDKLHSMLVRRAGLSIVKNVPETEKGAGDAAKPI